MKNKIFIESVMRERIMLFSIAVMLIISACSRETKSPELIENMLGIINVSVANLYTEPSYRAEMATQILLGAPIRVLQHDRNWYQVKTTEGYLAWIPENVFVKMDTVVFEQFKNKKKIIFTDDFGFAYESPDNQKQRASDLVIGCMLNWEEDAGNFYKVTYPDGRNAYVLKNQANFFDHWLSTREINADSIVKTALSLKGIPYLWGGTSVKGMDCSGFTKTVLLRHGIILLRDASEQATAGIPVDISKGYDNLLAGDLMFFGKKATKDKEEQIRHVAIYIGNQEFIHANGYVKSGSLNPESPIYDALNSREFIRATRIAGAVGTKELKVWPTIT
jgi:SH3-like domain-containing protein